MLKFRTLINEQKNTHMEHLEDGVLNGGVDGTRQTINFLRNYRDALSGHNVGAIDTTVKWDGAPAIFMGIDPSDGRFFVAKKGIFNKSPKVYKTPKEIDADTSGDLAVKLKTALQYFPELGLKSGVVQGDILYTKKDLKLAKIDGQVYLEFHPNTIAYAVPHKSALAAKIRRSKIGVVWHTTYTGKTFETMKATFGKPINDHLKHSANVWSTDAFFRDVSGKASFTAEETKAFTNILSRAGKLFTQLDPATLNGISKNENLLIGVKTHFNSKIRAGERILSPERHVDDLITFIHNKYKREAEAKKSDKGKAVVDDRRKEIMSFFSTTNKANLVNIFAMMNLFIEAKEIIIKKLNQTSEINTLIKTNSGYRVTGHEGYVAIDHVGNAVKLVDRLEFSHANFSPDVIKGWQR